MKILLLNGPPRSGKDTIGEIVKQLYPYQSTILEKFAKSVKEGTHGMLGIFKEESVEEANAFESWKDEPRPEFFGLTPRQAYIWYSEEVMKPKFGNDIFGRLTTERITRRHAERRDIKRVVITDSGFPEEALCIRDRFGAHNVVLVHLYREGCSFENDSRNYIEIPGVRPLKFRNPSPVNDPDNSISDLTVEVLREICPLIT